MNAITTIEITGVDHQDRFRSQLINRVAAIEAWAVQRLIGAGVDAKKAQLLSQRMDELRKCVKAHPSKFRNPDRVLKLLDDLVPFLTLRSVLAHSTASTHRAADGTSFILFETPCVDPALPWTFRTILRQEELASVLMRVSNLANQLNQQASA
ncbi:MAG TPA: hypothetical protein VEW25_09985 [Allosphingosinicella sp.]|nr:hypothetical protein [Allosphingosinicella sp.]